MWQSKQTIHSHPKPPPEYILKRRGKQKNGLNKVRNKISYIVLYVLHKVSNRQLYKVVGSMDTTKSRLQDVPGHIETHKAERIYRKTKRSQRRRSTK
jgi:hypothetical protein